MNSRLPSSAWAPIPKRGIVGSPAAPARGPGCTPGSREQQPFNEVSAYQWLIVAARQRSQPRATWNPASRCISHAWAPRGQPPATLPGHSRCPPASPAAWWAGRGGRKPAALPSALPFGHKRFSLGAKSQVEFIHQG